MNDYDSGYDDGAAAVVDENYAEPYGDGNLPAPRGKTEIANQLEVIASLAAVARANPRNEAHALRKILSAADASCVWAVPNRGSGLSVKCARLAVQAYRNVAVIPSIMETLVEVDGGRQVPGWKIQCLAIDMENMVIQMTSGTTTKPARKPGEKDLAYEQRCFQQQLAFSGRIERNAAMKIIPGSWQAQIRQAVDNKARMDPLEKRRLKLKNECAAIGITDQHARDIHGAAISTFNEEQWADFYGRVGAVRNKECTVEDAFPEAFGKDAEAPAPPADGKHKSGAKAKAEAQGAAPIFDDPAKD